MGSGASKGETGAKPGKSDPEKIENDEIKANFDLFDKDGSGFIERDELRELFRSLDSEWSEEHVDAAIGELDCDGDGKVSLPELRRFWGGPGPSAVPGTRAALEIAVLRRQRAAAVQAVSVLEARVEALEHEADIAELRAASIDGALTAAGPENRSSGEKDQREGPAAGFDLGGAASRPVLIVYADEDVVFAQRLARAVCGVLTGHGAAENDAEAAAGDHTGAEPGHGAVFDGGPLVSPIVSSSRGPVARNVFSSWRAAAVQECSAAVLVFSPAFFASRRCVMETKILSRRIERSAREVTNAGTGIAVPRLFLCNASPANIPPSISYTLGGDSGQRVMFFLENRSFAEHAQALAAPIIAFLKECGGWPSAGAEPGPDGQGAHNVATADTPKPVFNSYAVRTKDLVWPAYEALNSRGPLQGSLWIDKLGIVAGADWDSQISLALYDSRCAVIWLSTPFFASKNCEKEVKVLARRVERGEDIQMFPVFLEKNLVVPRALRFALADTVDPIILDDDHGGIDAVIEKVRSRVAAWLHDCSDGCGPDAGDDDDDDEIGGINTEGGREEDENGGTPFGAAPPASPGTAPSSIGSSAPGTDAQAKRRPPQPQPQRPPPPLSPGAARNERGKSVVRKVTREEMRNGFVPLTMFDHNCGGSVVAMDATSECVVSGSWDRTAVVWGVEPDAAGDYPRLAILEHDAHVRVVHTFAICVGRTFLATGCGGAGGPACSTVNIYDLTAICARAEGADVPVCVFDAHPDGNGVTAIAYSGGSLFTGGLDSRIVEWTCDDVDAPGLGRAWTFCRDHRVPDGGPAKPTGVMAIAHSDTRVVAACWASNPEQSEVRVLDEATFEVVASLKIHSPYPRSLTTDPKSGHIISTGKDGSSCEIDPESLEIVFTYRGHTQGVQSVYVGDGSLSNYLVTCGNDSRINIWDVTKRDIVTTHYNHRPNGKGYFANACVLAKGRAWVASGDGKILVFGIPT